MPQQRCLACMKEIYAGTVCPYCGSPVPCTPNSPESLQPGYELGRFIIGKEIGRGGYGITYIAFDKRLQTVRCIKEYFPKNCKRLPNMEPDIQPGRAAEFVQFAERFLTEARIMSSVAVNKVSNVVNVYDILNDDRSSAEYNHLPYIIMEYLEGCTMDEYILERKQPLHWREAVKVMCSVLRTLDEIHAQGYLHRDVSLSNIFRLKDGNRSL